jgi:thioesterase domain-containing protein/acyl carrier protein
MIDSRELLQQLVEQGVVLSVDGERLRLNAPKGVITPALQTAISENKQELLRLVQESSALPVGVPITRMPREQPQPLSISQERLWTLMEMAGDSPLYNMYLAFRLRGGLDLAALEASLQSLIERHEPLRTSFGLVDGQPFQQVQTPAGWSLPTIDLCGDLHADTRLAEYLDQEASHRFVPLSDRLFRAHLLRLADDEHVLSLVMHHLISDGWSWGVFLRELTVLYTGYQRGEVSNLPDLPIQYVDYAAWQQDFVTSPRFAAQMRFWEHTLHGVSPLELPLDAARKPSFDFVGSREELGLATGCMMQVRVLSRTEDVTPFMTLLAVFKAALHQITGQPDLLVGTPVAGRGQTELQGIIGYFNNILPLRTTVSRQESFRELLARVRSTALAAYDNADVPLHRLADHPDLMQVPFTRAVFAFQDGSGYDLSLDGLLVEALPIYNHTANFDISLTVRASEDELRLVVEYRSALFRHETILNFLQDYAALLYAALEKPDQPLVDLLPVPRTAMQALSDIVPQHGYVAPVTPLETRLVALWEEMFLHRPIGVQDSFFDLGGHSLLALRLFGRIQKEFKVDLPLATLFKDPTIRYLAELIERGEEQIVWNSLVPIQKTGSLPPFFGVHGIHGNILFWRNIVMHLGTDQPFYGLQSRGIDGRSRALESIPEMAMYYLQEVRQIQPHGPYYLGGYSLGGEIAFEMAQQLTRQGEQVALLVMFDTSNPNRAVRPVAGFGSETAAPVNGKLRRQVGILQRKFGGHLQRLQGLTLRQKLGYMRDDAVLRIDRLRLKMRVRLMHRLGRSLPDDVRLQYLLEAHMKAVINYIPEIYPGQITIFRARESEKDNPADSPMGWGPLARQGLQLMVFDGSHADVYNPAYAPQIAEMLKQCIAQSMEGCSTNP